MSRHHDADELRRALRDIAEAQAAELIEQARLGARERARALIEDALVQEILRAAIQVHASPAAAPERSVSADSERPPVNPAGGHAWWAYCVMRAREAPSLPPQLGGIEPGTAVELLTEGELAALISEVPMAEYDDQRLREHLEDLAWVERTARAHEDVLDRALTAATIVPLRLCTLHRDRDGVRRLLADHAAALADSLAAVDGCSEWGLKLFAGPGATDELDESGELGGDAPSRERAASERPGAAYLVAKQRERDAAARAAETRLRDIEQVHEQLSALARRGTSNPPQRRETHGRELEMVLNAAYLVERDRVEELKDAVAALRARLEPRGFVLELTGPWPAYNFVSSAAGIAS